MILLIIDAVIDAVAALLAMRCWRLLRCGALWRERERYAALCWRDECFMLVSSYAYFADVTCRRRYFIMGYYAFVTRQCAFDDTRESPRDATLNERSVRYLFTRVTASVI